MPSYSERLATFASWPHASPTPQDLAKAGFSHRPTEEHPDNAVYTTSKIAIYDWEPADDPELELHIHHYRCSKLWLVLATADRKKPSAKDIGFFDPSLQHDFPELCLFQNIHIFCDRVKRCRFFETDILELLPKCLRGEALTWFRQSEYQDLAECLRAMRARFPQALPQEAPQASLQEASQPIGSASQAPEYHHCKLCNASFSSMARLTRHAQENTCNKPSCRHCEMVFSSKNRLHHHLRQECQKRMHTRRSSSSSSPACSPACSPASSPSPISPRILPNASLPEENRASLPPPPPTYLTIADLSARYAAPPYLKVDDLFHMFGGRSAITKSSTITITIDDPFIKPFVSLKKSMGSIQKWALGIATSYHQILRAQCSPPRIATDHRCRPPLLNTDKWQANPIWV